MNFVNNVICDINELRFLRGIPKPKKSMYYMVMLKALYMHY